LAAGRGEEKENRAVRNAARRKERVRGRRGGGWRQRVMVFDAANRKKKGGPTRWCKPVGMGEKNRGGGKGWARFQKRESLTGGSGGGEREERIDHQREHSWLFAFASTGKRESPLHTGKEKKSAREGKLRKEKRLPREGKITQWERGGKRTE